MANPILAAIFSFFIPGLGQFYDGQFLRGAMIFIGIIIYGILAGTVGAILVWTVIVPILLSIFGLLIWIWNIYDAYQLAK
ncbi:hypothetical protein MsAg5_13760 [Methanosarcinaceae archaeon Ag5]|uniref:TM2 domain-containing protein n=1 Tax=Methanolapillus africanus TaxID=3028297 RepID=A0AAE4MJ84_9EURY|nr:hypothetical protein [Methanosarcinaceae archaeon Ag5]